MSTLSGLLSPLEDASSCSGWLVSLPRVEQDKLISSIPMALRGGTQGHTEGHIFAPTTQTQVPQISPCPEHRSFKKI